MASRVPLRASSASSPCSTARCLPRDPFDRGHSQLLRHIGDANVRLVQGELDLHMGKRGLWTPSNRNSLDGTGLEALECDLDGVFAPSGNRKASKAIAVCGLAIGLLLPWKVCGDRCTGQRKPEMIHGLHYQGGRSFRLGTDAGGCHRECPEKE